MSRIDRSIEIIYAKALESEPNDVIRGIIWHEFGHLIQAHIKRKVPEDDEEANEIVRRYFGVKLG